MLRARTEAGGRSKSWLITRVRSRATVDNAVFPGLPFRGTFGYHRDSASTETGGDVDPEARLGELRSRLSEARDTELSQNEGPPHPPAENIRATARAVGRRVALEIDSFWELSKEAGSGPIDVIDIFSGCGGMSAGFRAVNGYLPAYRLAMAVDTDSLANDSYQANFGLSPHQLDVSELARSRELLPDALRMSGRREDHPLVLIGCAPCQGFSSHRNGKDDDRNNLFTDFGHLATKLKPEIVVIENVPELLTDRYWPYVDDVRQELKREGYQVYVGVHNMAQFGLPQQRFRALLLAMRGAFEPPRGFLPPDEFMTVRDAIGDLPPVEAGNRLKEFPLHYSSAHRESTLETIRAVPKDGGNRPPDVGPESLQRLAEKQGKLAYEDVYGRLHWDRPSITITAHSRNPASGRFVHPEQDRALTIREAALLQGFPRSYRFEGSLGQCFRQIGNAVPPLFGAYVAAHLLGELVASKSAGDGSSTLDAPETGLEDPVGASFSRLIPTLKKKSGDEATDLVAVLESRT